MEARKWHEVESIELTAWTRRFLKYAKSLPPSAIKRISGKSIAQVLFETSALRHSAVHRLPTSAAGILNMLHAAMTFAEALNDPKRAERVAEIKSQLEASIEEIVQHQNLLERKLKEQLEDIARRRAELDELERSSITEMLATDKEQRSVVGSALESFLFVSQQISNPCPCNHTPSFDGAKADSEGEENIESSGTGMYHVVFFQFMSHLFLGLFLIVPLELEPKVPETIDEAQACEQSPLGEWEPHQVEEVEEDIQPAWHNNNGGGVEEKPEVSELTLSTLRSKGKGKKGKKEKKEKKKKSVKEATSGWGIPAVEEAPVLVEEAPVLMDEAPAPEEASPALEHVYWKRPRYGAWNFGATRDVPAESQNAVGESIQPEEPCPVAPEEPSHPDDPYNIVPMEEPEPEDAFPAREPGYNEELMGAERPAPDATPESSQAELITKDLDDAEEHTLNQYDNVVRDLVDSYESTPGLDVASMPSPPAEHTEFMRPPPKPALSAVCDELDFHHPRPPSAPPSTKTSVFEAAAAQEEAPTEDSHTITLKILHGSKVLRSIVFIKACTRTAILKEARAYCVKCARDDQSLAMLLEMGYDLALMSLKMYGYDTDLSTYKVENLSSLVKAIEKTGIPRFTLRISEV